MKKIIFLLFYIVIIIIYSCENKIGNVNNDIHELNKLIKLDLPLENCTFEYSKLGDEKSRLDIGPNDYGLIAVLKINDKYFEDLVKQIKIERIGSRYLDEKHIKEWFPPYLKGNFEKEGDFYFLKDIYSIEPFVLKNSSLSNGFCFIGNNNTILIFMYTS